MQLDENLDSGLTTAEDDPYLMMNHEKRAKMREALKEMQRYCNANPESPSAAQRPQLSVRSGVWILLLGPSVSEGIAGFGHSVVAALRAFDAQYLRTPRQPGNSKFQRAIAHRVWRETSGSRSGYRGLTNSTETQYET